jgi:hypothetical protein
MGLTLRKGLKYDEPLWQRSQGEMKHDHVSNAIKALLAGEPAPVKTTRPYG